MTAEIVSNFAIRSSAAEHTSNVRTILGEYGSLVRVQLDGLKKRVYKNPLLDIMKL